ncbi:MAG: hypothetical protein CMI09_10975 [Oceanospirillaceae bacterium]|nr:hypothetical protein [Oceanospirillaceae bacterium]
MNKQFEKDLRSENGFCSKEVWCDEKALFTDDSLIIAGHHVMDKWQSNYMRCLAKISSKYGGRILEVGYGMGIAAEFVEMNKNVEQHVIIECHPDVVKKCRSIYRKKIEEAKVVIYEDFWENVTSNFPEGYFDGILFDTYPLSQKEIRKNHFFFFVEAYRLLRKGGVLTYYSDETENFSEIHMAKLREAGFESIDKKMVKVDPPESCAYWESNSILAPIVKK